MTTGDADRQRRSLAIFDQVVDLDTSARAAALDALCAGDDGLRARVEAMLAADASTSEPFAGDAAHWADALTPEPAAAPGDAAAAAIGRGETIGAWRITGLLGRGGMGAVHAVERADGAYAQDAALKRVHAGEVSASSRERFLRERQVLARLQHPHIATLLDGGFTAAGDPYFVMERVDGVPIDRWCDDQALSLRERVVLFLQVLDAVQYAHRNLVVHRDLKPSNLLVTADGRVKLLDFGIARELEAAGGLPATATSDRAMTLAYASPEQLDNSPITTATDIYQLGVVLYRLLAGRHPFGIDADTPLARQLQQLSRDPEPLTQGAREASAEVAARRGESPASLARAVDGSLEAIVHACLQRDPAHRYASAEALGNDLRAWLDDRPVSAAPVGRRERTRLWLRRNRVLAASAAAIAVALLAGTGLALWQAREARAQAAIAEREGARARAALAYLTDTLSAAAPEQAMSTEVSVRQLLDHARAELSKRRDLDPSTLQSIQRMLGHLYMSIGDGESSAALFEQGLRGVDPRTRDEALAIADDLVGYSSTLTGLERGPESLETAERAVALRERFAPGDPLQEFLALAHISYGHYTDLGPEACEARVRRALAIADAHPEIPAAEVLDARSTLAGLLNMRTATGDLLQAADDTLAFLDARGYPADSTQRIRFLRYRAEALADSGRAIDAVPAIREAIAVQETTGSGGTPPAVLYNTLGKASAYLGDYRAAAQAFERSLAFQDSSIGAASTSTVVGNLALIEAWTGDYPGSLARFGTAIAAMDAADVAADHASRRVLERNRAAALLLAGRLPEADAELTRLQALAKTLDGTDSNEYLQTTSRLVQLARRLAQPARGEPLLAEMRALLAKNGPASSPLFAGGLRAEAAFKRMRGDLAGAEEAQRLALERLEAGQNRFDVAAARVELAEIHLAQGDEARARQLLAEARPVMAEAVLPTQVDRVSADALAHRLRM